MELERFRHALEALGLSFSVEKARKGYAFDSVGVSLYNPADVNRINRLYRPLALMGFPGVSARIDNGLLWFDLPITETRSSPSFDAVNYGALSDGVARFGMDTDGRPVSLCFPKVPHVLIAGETGSGKSVLLHSVIASLLLSSPGAVLDIVDTKRVEYLDYNGRARLSVTASDAVERLHSIAFGEMDYRYRLISAFEARDLSGVPGLKRHFIVIDELADLMLVSRYEAEASIVRIAQLGRACGIHLILATQRPTVDVVTGLIKANMPARIALKVASFRDSITILDHKGAEALLGAGDAILKANATETRFQSCVVHPDEERNIISASRR